MISMFILVQDIINGVLYWQTIKNAFYEQKQNW